MVVVPCPVAEIAPLWGSIVATDVFDELQVTEMALPVWLPPRKNPGANAVNVWLPPAAIEGFAGLT